jgi:hypothetical protein
MESVVAGLVSLFAYIHGNIGAVHALSDDFAIVNKDTADWCLVRSKCQLSLNGRVSIFSTLVRIGKAERCLVGKRRTMLMASRMKASW